MSPPKIPIILLKTRSSPRDSYHDHFARPDSALHPVFVPVLEHKPDTVNLEQIKTLLRTDGELGRRYGGVIFTSQRAVEAFAGAVGEVEVEMQEEAEGERGEQAGSGGEISGSSTTYISHSSWSGTPLHSGTG
jgi:hypothetical protein